MYGVRPKIVCFELNKIRPVIPNVSNTLKTDFFFLTFDPDIPFYFIIISLIIEYHKVLFSPAKTYNFTNLK